MPNHQRIEIPWRQRWRWIRYRSLPVVSFACAAVITGWLWTRFAGSPGAVGEVFAVRLDVASHADGLLADLPDGRIQLFETVQAGHVIARLDDEPVRAQAQVLQTELKQLRASLVQAEETARIEQEEREEREASEARRLAIWVEESRLDVLDRKALIEADRIELGRLEETLRVVQQAFDRKALNKLDMINAQYERNEAAERIQRNQEGLTQAEEQHRQASRQKQAHEPAALAAIEKLLAPVRGEIDVQEARIRELEIQIGALDMRAPISGVVAAIFRYPGQTVRRGDPVVSIAAPQGEYILSYIRQNRGVQPQPGMAVVVHLRTIPTQTVASYIQQVGPQVEPVPPHQLRDPKLLEWGLPVRIALPAGVTLRPGELVDVRLKPSETVTLDRL